MFDAIAYIHSKSWLGSIPGLSRTQELLEKLCNPEKGMKFIHVAGTNGKGSTAQFICATLMEAGYKTGLYTSPFIHKFNERIKINNVDISDENLNIFTEIIKNSAEKMEISPTEFELITALAFLYFAKQNCDVVVLEVGMGGLLDSTNVIKDPVCSVITNIGLDHEQFLGDSIAKIAIQKAGIIKQDCPTVLYNQSSEVNGIVRGIAEENRSPFFLSEPECIKLLSSDIYGQNFTYKGLSLFTSMLGEHQLRNIAVALKTIEVLNNHGFLISDEDIKKGFSNAKWPARFEVLQESPMFIVDGGHNAQCAISTAKGLQKYFPNKKIIFVIGVLKDKSLNDILAPLLPLCSEFFTVTPNNPRALSSQNLAVNIEAHNVKVTCCDTIENGLKSALAVAKSEDIVCAFGSLYMTGEIREFFGFFN